MAEDLKQLAYKAVQAASTWMIELRKAAPLEGFDPWSDKYTDYKRGIMSTAEGLTAMSLIYEYNKNNNLKLPIVDEEILYEDIDWLIAAVTKEGGYRGTPYIDESDTKSFVDAVSYYLTALLGVYDIAKGELKEKIEKEIINATKWFITNRTQKDKTYGWASIGLEEIKEKEIKEREEWYPPQTYFTFASIIPLCDVVGVIENIARDIKNDIIDTLQGAKDFLIKHNREEEGWIDFIPTKYLCPDGYNKIVPTSSVLATCYALHSLTYIKCKVPEVRFSDEDERVIDTAIKWIKKIIKGKIDRIFGYQTKYPCTRGGKQYLDGCAPYTILNAIARYYDAYPDKMTDDDKKLIDSIVEEILDKCWGKTPSSGFKHFVSPDPFSPENILAIYATTTGIEALLNFGVEMPLEITPEYVIQEEFALAQKRIGERLRALEATAKKFNVQHDVALVINETIEHIENDWTMLIGKETDELPRATLLKWQQFAPDGNKKHMKELLTNLITVSIPSDFKVAIDRFDKGYGEYLLKPCKRMIEALRNIPDDKVKSDIKRHIALISVLKETQGRIKSKTEIKE